MRRIFCFHLPWSQSWLSTGALDGVPLFLPGHQRTGLARSTRSQAPDSGLIRISITGRVHLQICVPGSHCAAKWGPLEPYTGTLTVDRSTGLPLSLSGTIHFGRIAQHQTVTFSYSSGMGVSLPSGPRISCPSWTQAGYWCLGQKVS